MTPHLDRWVLAVALAATSCVPAVPPYQPPTADQPHATLKVRRVYESRAGTTVDEHSLVNGHMALAQVSPMEQVDAPRTDAFLVHPGAITLAIGARFFHSEMQWVNENYTEQKSYTDTEYYPCGHSTCSRLVTRYRTEYKTRRVMQPVDVTDSTCGRAVDFTPVVGHVYLISFTYQANDVCAVTCLEQTAVPDGTFTSQQCPLLAPAPSAPAHSADPLPPPRAAPDVSPPAQGLPIASSAGVMPSALPPPPPPPELPKMRRPLAPYGTASLVAGMAGLGAGIVTGVLAMNAASDVHAHCNANRLCDAEGLDAASKGPTYATASTASVAGGAALAAAGIVLLALPGTPVTAGPAPQGLGLSLQGAF